MANQTRGGRRSGEQDSFLPDLCHGENVLLAMLATELLAVVLTLARPESAAMWFIRLGLYSLYMQWVTLSCLSLLCLARRRLARFSDRYSALLAYLIILAVALFIGVVSWWLFSPLPIWGAEGEAHTPWNFLLRSLAISGILGALFLHYLYMQHQWRRRIVSENQAQVRALQARIRPHFLFNTMNTLAALVRDDPAQAELLIENLCALFRVALREFPGLVRLPVELDLCRRYLEMERLRLGKRLQVQWDIAALPDDAGMPPLTLQPLLENAVYHGIEPRHGGGCIRVSAGRSEQALQIRIENPLPESWAGGRQEGHRLALENVRERLQHSFPGPTALLAEERQGRFLVTLEFPFCRVEGEDPDRR